MRLVRRVWVMSVRDRLNGHLVLFISRCYNRTSSLNGALLAVHTIGITRSMDCSHLYSHLWLLPTWLLIRAVFMASSSGLMMANPFMARPNSVRVRVSTANRALKRWDSWARTVPRLLSCPEGRGAKGLWTMECFSRSRAGGS